MNIQNTIDKIVAYAIYVTEPEEIILFGSMVNQTANIYSDVDMLIISDSDKKEGVSKIRNFVFQLSLKTDVLIFSREEFEKQISLPVSFLKAVQKSGKIVYKNSNKKS